MTIFTFMHEKHKFLLLYKSYLKMKELINKKFPFLVSAYRGLRRLQIRAFWQKRRDWSLQEVFQDAYEGMSKLESASGGGSTLTATERIRKEFPAYQYDATFLLNNAAEIRAILPGYKKKVLSNPDYVDTGWNRKY